MDSSFFDEICENCGATDGPGDDGLKMPCPNTNPGGWAVPSSHKSLESLESEITDLNRHEEEPCIIK
jgi:hypothetical protein